MSRSALVAATLLLLLVTLLVVFGCGESSADPTPTPAGGESRRTDQTVVQPGAVRQVEQPTPVEPATVEAGATRSAAPATAKTPVATGPPQRSPVPPQVFPMPMQVDYVTANSLGELVAESALIVIGTTADAEPREERVPGRLPGEPSRPDPNYTMIGNVYEVEVERYLRGEGGTTLRIIQSIGFDAIVPGPPNMPDRLTQGRNDSLGVRLGKGNRYLLFLKEFEDVPELWTGTVEPYRFLLEDGRAQVESPVGNVGGEFSSRSEDELVSFVEELLFVSLPNDLPQSGESGPVSSPASPSSPIPASDPISPTSTPAVSEALLQDARHYAAGMGVDLDEAVRRLQAQRTIGELGAELEANEQSTFGGLWIQHKPEFKVVVAFTLDGEETVRPYIQGTSLADMVEVREVEATLAELREAQSAAGEILNQLGIRASSGIDITNNVVQLYLSEAEKEELDAELKKSGLKLPDKVEVVS